MFRPRSYTALTVQQQQLAEKLAVPSHQSPSTAERSSSRSTTPPADDDGYSGGKCKDASVYQRLVKARIWLRHKLAACISSEQLRRACLAGVLLVLLTGVWALYAHTLYKASLPRHLVVLDAGSTGTRVHVFSYAVDPRSSYAQLQLPEPKLKVEPGLSSYAADAAGAGASLQPLLEFARQHVPVQQQAQTPVYLMATAGLRLLPIAAADAILEHCRSKLMASSFLFEPDWASIISGTSEGLYGWVAANYAAGSLQRSSSAFKALIELGGASAQVTFMPDQHKEWLDGLMFRAGVSRALWSHSYLGYGFDVVEHKVEQLVKQQAPAAAANGSRAAAPAVPADLMQTGQPNKQQQQQAQQLHDQLVVSPTAEGSGEWQQCQRLVAEAIAPSNCKPAPAGTPCPEIPSHMPRLAGQLLATENFAYTARALALAEQASIGEFASAARRFCSKPWPQTLQDHSREPQQQRYLWRYCFGSAFAWTLLHDVLHLGEGQVVQFANTLRVAEGADVGLDWALGAAVLQLSRGARSEQGALVRRQQRAMGLVLAAALAGTAAVLGAAGVTGLRWWTARQAVLKQQAGCVGINGQAQFVSGVPDGVWACGGPGAGKQLYAALSVSTRVHE
ncbi:nucleoside phosphatase family-domain-containing protein [Scenedesmus sp. NREL 46B-D3]|nr:nucleoside phosphatase family-domain-containing protein [Scenedesmus sp. NREL 46B-D3]